jgi:hypothetical protein
MFSFTKIVTFSLLLFIPFVHFAQSSTGKTINKTTQSGEVLTYKIYYTLAGIYANTAEVTFSNTLEKLNNKPVYHFVGNGKTYPSYDWFFKVRDVYESFVDTATMLPYKFIRNISEGKNKMYHQAIFNQTNNTAISTQKLIKTPASVQDVLSSIYYARNIDFANAKINDKIYFNMYLDDVVYPIYLTYLGKSTIKTKFGTYNTLKFRPKLIEGTIFKGGEKMTVYVTDDENKIPVYIETPIIIGTIKVYFFAAKGLRN